MPAASAGSSRMNDRTARAHSERTSVDDISAQVKALQNFRSATCCWSSREVLLGVTGDDGINRSIRCAHRVRCVRANSVAPIGGCMMGALTISWPIAVGTLARYFGLRFLTRPCGVRRHHLADRARRLHRADAPPRRRARRDRLTIAQTSFYRVPQLAERVMPFAVLIAAMSSFLDLSRRLELVIARAAGMSAWQFIAPAFLVAAMIGALTTTALQSDRRGASGKVEAAGSADFRQRAATGTASDAARLLDAPTQRRRSGDRPCRDHQRTGCATGWRDHVHVRPEGLFRSASKPAPPCSRTGFMAARRARIYGDNVAAVVTSTRTR